VCPTAILNEKVYIMSTHSTETLSSAHAKYDHHSTSVSRYTI
jgi:hypothetical protein